MYDTKLLNSIKFDLPVICIGNLNVGGTGKTPMIEYLLRQLAIDNNCLVLSRGYKRKTQGLVIANQQTTIQQIGDESYQLFKKFPKIAVAVAENRMSAIPDIMAKLPNTNLILLDDAFQHRSVKAGLSILLSSYNDLFVDDLLLPAGNLREAAFNSKRADIVIITKCPVTLSVLEKEAIENRLRLKKYQKSYFSSISYGKPYYIFDNQSIVKIGKDLNVLLISGIASTQALTAYIEEQATIIQHLNFSDHHSYDEYDLLKIREQRELYKADLVICTEKDAVKLWAFKDFIVQNKLPIFVLPMKHNILFNQEKAYNSDLNNFIEYANYKRINND